MFRAILLALRDLADKSFRQVLWQALGLTLLLLSALVAAAHYGLGALPKFETHWLNTAVDIAGDLGIVVGSVLLAAPVASLFVAFFLDGIAERVEKKHYPSDPPGRSLGFWPSITTGIAFLLALLLVNLVALPLYFIPGANLAVYLIVNGLLLGREYFELVALRHGNARDIAGLRRRYRIRIFLAGVIIALALSVPILNLLAPLFGTAFMVHVFKTVRDRHGELNAPPTRAA